MRAPCLLAAIALLVACTAAPAASAPLPPPPPPPPGSELLVMNDGAKPVREVRVRRPTQGKGGWSENLLGREVIEVNEGRRFDIGALNLGCEVEVKLLIEGRALPVRGEQAVCSEPRFWVRFASGVDAPGMGVRPGTYAIVVAEEDAPAPSPSMTTPAAPRDLNRGLPICPGDPRCKRKK